MDSSAAALLVLQEFENVERLREYGLNKAAGAERFNSRGPLETVMTA